MAETITDFKPIREAVDFVPVKEAEEFVPTKNSVQSNIPNISLPFISPEMEQRIRETDILNTIVKTNKDFWESNDKYWSEKFANTNIINKIPYSIVGSVAKIGNFLSPESGQDLREWSFAGSLSKTALQAAEKTVPYVYNKLKTIIKSKTGKTIEKEIPKIIDEGIDNAIRETTNSKEAANTIIESKNFINDLYRHLNKTDEQRISQQVNQGIDKAVNELPFNRFTGVKEKIVNDWQRVKEISKSYSGDLTPYERRKLMFKRQATRLGETADRVQTIDKDVLNTSKQLGLDSKEFQKTIDSYLVARHAPERNLIHGEQATPVTTIEAKAIQQKIDLLPYSNEVKRIANDMQQFHNGTLDILYADGQPWGVIDKATYDNLKSVYPNHIPLNRIIDEDDMVLGLTNSGLDVKGSGLFKAKGSQRKIKDIMENIYTARTQAIKRVEKNIVDNETYNMVSEYIKEIPGQTLFRVDSPKVIGKTFAGKPIFEKITDPHVLQFQRSGRPVAIRINDAKLASALRGINREQLPGVLKFFGTVTRYMSQMATRYNPEFPLSNKIRDLQEAMIYLASQKNIGLKGAGQTVFKDPASAKAVTDFLRGRKTEGANLYQELRFLGGAGEGLALSTKNQVGESLNNIRKLNRNKAYRSFKKIVDGIDKWNLIFEDSTRLSAYKQALKNGYSKDKAAVIAKNASIDFDEMGTWGPVVNSMYMFSNASIQGSAKMLRAMKNPKVASAVVGSLGSAVFAVNKYNDSIDPDWRNKVSKWDRLNGLNVVIPQDDPDEFYNITIPISWGLKPIKVALEYASDIAYDQDVDLSDAAGQVLTSLAEGYNPTGGVDLSSSLTPSFARPFVDVAMNRTWWGGQLKPDNEAPESIRYYPSLEKSTTGKALVEGTKKLSEVSENTIEISPADVHYFLQQAIGGAGRFGQKVFNTVSNVDKIQVKNIPFASRILRQTSKEQFRETDENITRKLRGIQKEEFYLKKNQDKFFNAIEKKDSERNISLLLNWMRKQSNQKYLENRYIQFRELKDVDKANWKWWMDLTYEPNPRAQALIYYNRWKRLDRKGKDKLRQKLGYLDSTKKFNFSDRFWAEFKNLTVR